jgi:hypothetical protein
MHSNMHAIDLLRGPTASNLGIEVCLEVEGTSRVGRGSEAETSPMSACGGGAQIRANVVVAG